MLRDYTRSEIVNSLSDKAEILFIRLLLQADDFGRYHANPKIISSTCYPLKEVKASDITKALNECVKVGLIKIYEAEQKLYLEIQNFKQRLRQKISKFPDPGKEHVMPADIANANTTRKAQEKKPKPTIDEIREYCKSKALPFADADYLFNHWMGNGFTNNGKPIKDWKRVINAWMAAGHLPKNQPEYQREASPIKKVSDIAEPEDWKAIAKELYPNLTNLNTLNWSDTPEESQKEILNHLKQ